MQHPEFLFGNHVAREHPTVADEPAPCVVLPALRKMSSAAQLIG
jgi:hypothetical protein